ncbi:MAG: S8 family serine peptidase, partial [Pseudomonadota bacterium]
GGTSTKIRLAVVDTGVDETHDDFSGRIARSANCYLVAQCTEGSQTDNHGHGTHVAGVVLGSGASCDEPGDTAYFETTGTLQAYNSALSAVSFFTAQFNGAVTDNLSAKMTWDGAVGTQAGVFFRDKTNAEAESSTFISPGADYSPALTVAGPGVTAGSFFSATNFAVSSTAGEYVIPYGFTAYTNDANVLGNEYWARIKTIVKGWGDGLPRMGGVSYQSELVAVKSLGADGSGSIEDIVRGLEYIYSIAETEGIVGVNLSFSVGGGVTSQVLDTAAQNLVNIGVAVVVSAGNDQESGTYVSSPGTEESVITVGAVNNNDELTEYSSLGNPRNSVLKPDVLAPGGSRVTKVYIASTRTLYDNWWNHVKDPSLEDPYTLKVGTSQAAPFVTGLVGLMASKRQGAWSYNVATLPNLFKMLLCMSAYEIGAGESGTVGGEVVTAASPGTPERAGGLKDRFEGYGRVSAQGALSAFDAAWDVENNPTSSTFTFGTSGNEQKSIIKTVTLSASKEYNFTMAVPSGADYDLYLFNATPDQYGQPILLASSALVDNPTEHIIDFIPPESGTYYIVAKWVSGSGTTDIDLSLERDKPATPTVISNFRVDRNMRDKTIYVYWTTNVPTNAVMQHGIIGGLGQQTSATEYTTEHSFSLNMEYENSYYLRVLSSSQGSSDADISTAVSAVYKVDAHTGNDYLLNDISIEDLPVMNDAGGCGTIGDINNSGNSNSVYSVIMFAVPLVYLYFRRRKLFDKGL